MDGENSLLTVGYLNHLSKHVIKEEEMKKHSVAFALILAIGFVLAGCDMPNGDRPATTTTTDSKAKLTDSELENAIMAKFNADSGLAGLKLDVDANADRNEVTLSGTVESQTQRTRAVEIARNAHTGLVITDKIDVKPREITRAEYTEEQAAAQRARARDRGETVGETLDDAWIHTKIVTKLIGNPDTPQRKINVDVKNNVVTLRGTVTTAAEKTEAERVAKETEGVKQVKNQLRVSANA
jgi:osmotically-inducible protein OsmY